MAAARLAGILARVAEIDLVDETFIAASPDVIATQVADPDRWRTWWPDLKLEVFMDRGVSGQRWSVHGAFVGSAEIWVEAFGDGAILHYYLRVVPTARGSETAPAAIPDTPAGWRQVSAVRARRARDWKRHVWAFKDEMEAGREPGEPGVRAEGRQ